MLRHYLNGEKVAEIELGSEAWDEAIADSKFSGWDGFAGRLLNDQPGHIALQDHGDEVWFRDITVRAPSADAADEDADGAAADER